MEILKSVILLLCLSLCITSCSDSDSSALDYQSAPFCAEISFELDSLRATARIISISKESVTLEFTSPSSLKGISFEKKSDSLSARLDDLAFTEPADSYLWIIELFDVKGAIKKTAKTKIGTVDCTRVDVISGGDLFNIYLKPDGTPCRISRKQSNKYLSVDVLAFKRLK